MAVLSHGLWQRRFGADETLVGRTVKLEGQAHTVIGILPPSAEFPEKPGSADSARFEPGQLERQSYIVVGILPAHWRGELAPSDFDFGSV